MNNECNNCGSTYVSMFFKGVLIGLFTPWLVGRVIKDTVRKVVIENQKKGS